MSFGEAVVKAKCGNEVSVNIVGNNFVGVVDKAAATIKLVTK